MNAIRFRPYTGSVDHYAPMLRTAAEGLHIEACGLRRRLSTEDQAGAIVASHIATVERALELAAVSLAEIKRALAEDKEEHRDAA